MKLNKKELALIYMCVFDEIDAYTEKDKREDGIKYTQLTELLKKIKTTCLHYE
jgi:hypothetical protein